MTNIDQIRQQANEALSQMKELAKDNPKAQKQIAVIEQVTNAATQLVSDFSKITTYDRKLPRFVRKAKYSKRESARLKAVSVLNLEMNKRQLQATMQTPIPKFPKGSLLCEESGIVTLNPRINDYGEILMINRDIKLPKTPYLLTDHDTII